MDSIIIKMGGVPATVGTAISAAPLMSGFIFVLVAGSVYYCYRRRVSNNRYH